MERLIIEHSSWIYFAAVAGVLYGLSRFCVPFWFERISRARKEREIRAEINSKLESLSPMERKILDIVKAGKDCGVWVSQKDAGVLTLIHKGLLKRVGDVSIWEDWDGGREMCILVTIPEKVREMN